MTRFHEQLTIEEAMKDIKMRSILLKYLPKIERALPNTRFMSVPIVQVIPNLRKSLRKNNLILALEEIKTLS